MFCILSTRLNSGSLEKRYKLIDIDIDGKKGNCRKESRKVKKFNKIAKFACEMLKNVENI